jgi:hypothetical protein
VIGCSRCLGALGATRITLFWGFRGFVTDAGKLSWEISVEMALSCYCVEEISDWRALAQVHSGAEGIGFGTEAFERDSDGMLFKSHLTMEFLGAKASSSSKSIGASCSGCSGCD